MKIRLLCLLILTISICKAQISFDSKKVIVETRGYAAKVTSLAYSDLDNDNQKDLIATSYYDNSIFWYKNVGGDFTYHSIIKITDNFYLPDYLCAKDLDNDGYNDVIATSQYGNTVVWFKNLGNNTFSEALTIGNINAPLPVISDDIDNDGDSDVIVGISDSSSLNDDSVVLFKNLGNGVFQSGEVLYLGSSNINIVKLVDLNNDGLLDIVSGARDGTVQYAKNLGNATFSNPISIGSGGNDGKSFDFIDIDNDVF